ncbi:MAG: archaetidylserine decarboxylase [Gammaproteobacteria bacterium]|nr:archaetidylserine decarboxylase [Gammaproteobacteria bacterium]
MHPFATLQHLLPQHGLSRLLGRFAASRNPVLKRLLIEGFKAAYHVDMTEFQGDSAADFASFNAFFTRPLLPGTRPMPTRDDVAVSPADGVVSQAGTAVGGELLQAKGRSYTVADLVGDDDFAQMLADGPFATIYLAPHNYHRVHAPCAASLVSTLEIPGRLFSVNAVTEAHVAGLFARNERLVLRLKAAFGEYALVLVGAMIVASIDVTWPQGPVSPYREPMARFPTGVAFERGDGVAAFQLGSTVVVLFPPEAATLTRGLEAGRAVRVGTPIATLRRDPN